MRGLPCETPSRSFFSFRRVLNVTGRSVPALFCARTRERANEPATRGSNSSFLARPMDNSENLSCSVTETIIYSSLRV